MDDKTDIMPLRVVMDHFSLERVVKAGAIFDKDKLLWMNGVYLRQLSPSELAERMWPFLERDLPAHLLPVDREYLLRIVPLVQERIKLLSESAGMTAYFFQTELDYDLANLVQRGMDQQSTLVALQRALVALTGATNFGHQPLEELLRSTSAELGLSPRQFFGVLRVATTGRTAAPPLFETLEVLGRERTLHRIQAAIDQLSVQV
jgi:glutamyl-tRNA synthetase